MPPDMSWHRRPAPRGWQSNVREVSSLLRSATASIAADLNAVFKRQKKQKKRRSRPIRYADRSHDRRSRRVCHPHAGCSLFKRTAEIDRMDAGLARDVDQARECFAISWRRTSVADVQSSHRFDGTVFVRPPSGNSSPSRG